MAAQSAFDDLVSLDLQNSHQVNPAFSTSLQKRNEAPASKLSGTEDAGLNHDLFSTLFAPSTPHASPNSSSEQLPLDGQKGRKAAPPPLHKRSASMSSQASDFGSFVSVSSFDDPLSNVLEDDLQEPVTATYASTNLDPQRKDLRRSPSGVSTTSGSASRSDHTLSFFDQFTRDAKQRSDERSSVLNELLLHEDDPLYFLNTPSSPPPPPVPPKSPPVTSNTNAFASLDPLQNSQSTSTLRPLTPPPPATYTQPNDGVADLHRDFDFQHDVDHHFFRLPSSTPPTLATLRPSPYSPPQPEATTQIRPGRNPPIRSSSISVADPQPAAPITSVRSVVGSPSAPGAAPPSLSLNSDSDHEDDNSYSLHDDESTPTAPDREQHPDLKRAQSFSSLSGSLSSISEKWMPTFLRGSGQAAPMSASLSGGARPALESIFRDARDPHPNSQTLPSSLSASASTGNPIPRHIQPTFTHNSAFSASPPPISGLPATSYSSGSGLTHGASPFAPHVYVPPSGAPGYVGEGYGAHMWDKGFSEELEREMRNGGQRMNAQNARSGPVAGAHIDSGPGTGGGALWNAINAHAPSVKEVEKDKEDRGRGGRWGSGFGFGFGSIRGRSSATNDDASSAATGAPVGQNGKRGGQNSAPGNMEVADTGGGMGAFIEQKTGKIDLRGRKEMTTPVLTAELATKLRPSLPALARLPKAWTLIYSIDQHGISLNTLYSRCEAHASRRPVPGEVLNTSMLIIVKDADGGLFGVWLADGIRGLKAGRGYFGGGESFLWKYHHDKLNVYKCTGKNNYVALCEPEYISFGGGDGHYGLYLDDTLFDGSSAPCPTFNNDPLCSPGPKKGCNVSFECVGLEIWGMGP